MSRLDALSEIWRFLKQRKRYWLIPVLAAFIALGLLLTLAQTSAVAPFIYTLF